MRHSLPLVLAVAGCGIDTGFDVPPSGPLLPVRIQRVTDAQYGNVVRDLFGDVAFPTPRSPGAVPHQFLYEDVLAIDAPELVQYRIAAEAVAAGIAADPARLGCGAADAQCLQGQVDALATRAFRRPLDPVEHDQLAALYVQGAAGGDPGAGIGLVVEAVLQAPSFVYRTEMGAPGGGAGGEIQLTSYELANELAALLLDSIPDEPLWQAARDGALSDPAVFAAQVDRLLGTQRVKAHLTDVVLDWLGVPAILAATKDPTRFPELTPELRTSMYDETRTFVSEVLWHRGGSLRALLTSNETYIDSRLAELYGVRHVDSTEPTRVTLDPKRRAGILTHASVLAQLASAQSESIVQRGLFVERKFLCVPDPGRPPASAIAAVADQTSQLSEAQFSVFRTTTEPCMGCHGSIDPPGRTLHHYDGLGRWRDVDLAGADVDASATVVLDDHEHPVDGAVQLAAALAGSKHVARCVVGQIAHHALGREIDDQALLDYLYRSFERHEFDLVDVFRSIAIAPAFRLRKVVP
jgi:hypothetical protein